MSCSKASIIKNFDSFPSKLKSIGLSVGVNKMSIFYHQPSWINLRQGYFDSRFLGSWATLLKNSFQKNVFQRKVKAILDLRSTHIKIYDNSNWNKPEITVKE